MLTGVEALAWDAHFQGVFVFQPVVGDLTQPGQVLWPVTMPQNL